MAKLEVAWFEKGTSNVFYEAQCKFFCLSDLAHMQLTCSAMRIGFNKSQIWLSAARGELPAFVLHEDRFKQAVRGQYLAWFAPMLKARFAGFFPQALLTPEETRKLSNSLRSELDAAADEKSSGTARQAADVVVASVSFPRERLQGEFFDQRDQGPCSGSAIVCDVSLALARAMGVSGTKLRLCVEWLGEELFIGIFDDASGPDVLSQVPGFGNFFSEVTFGPPVLAHVAVFNPYVDLRPRSAIVRKNGPMSQVGTGFFQRSDQQGPGIQRNG